MPPILELRDITKVYKTGTRALDGISLDIQRGEFVVLIGLSGSGKSTLLRCINRLVEPSGGRIVFEGVDITRARGSQRTASAYRCSQAKWTPRIRLRRSAGVAP